MGMFWCLLAACIACCFIHANCRNPAGEHDDGTYGDASVLAALFGYYPCLDESCASPPSVPETEVGFEDYEPQIPEVEALGEHPKIHCIVLRPSAVKTFGEVESMHTGISDIKYGVLEELIYHMHPFATLKLENCSPRMKLVDLIILAANTLKTQYVLQGEGNCTYRSSKDRSGELAKPGDSKVEPPCKPGSSGYVTSEMPCPAGTKEPEVTTQKMQTTEKPCLDGVTTEHPCQKPTEKPTEKPCPDGVTTEHPCLKPTEKPTEKPCPDGVTTEHPCQKPTEKPYSSTTPTEVLAEDDEPHVFPPFTGSVRGIPGVHYPNYTEVPITSFSCADKKYIPGFYADLETGCQVFHVCYEHRRESFLCPVGTIFNQPILACDFWYSSNCSLAPLHFKVNENTKALEQENFDAEIEEFLSIVLKSESEELRKTEYKPSQPKVDIDTISKLLPIKAQITDRKPDKEAKESSIKKPETREVEKVASSLFDKIMTKATDAASKTRGVVKSIPEPSEWKTKPVFKTKPVQPQVMPQFKVKPMKVEELLAKSVIPLAKAKVAAVKAAFPVAAKASVAAAIPAAKLTTKAKIAVPVMAAKMKAVPAAKVAGVKATIPVVAKAKLAAVIPKFAAKAYIPALKTKMIASALPLAKAKIVAPALKGKVLKGAGVPLLKAKVLGLPLAKSKLAGSVPLAKVKLAKAAAISPLTKKALALGYMKLLKAKKLALMG